MLRAVEHYGIPRVAVVDNRLRVTLDSAVPAQSLFVIEQIESSPQLVGVVVFTREDDTLIVLFIAVCEDRSLRGLKPSEMLYFRMLDEVRRIGRSVKGIESITLFCPNRLRMNLRCKAHTDGYETLSGSGGKRRCGAARNRS